MIIEMQKFGSVLNSRPAGREAFLAIRPTLPYTAEEMGVLLGVQDSTGVTLDFGGVDVLTPSFADEFITPLITLYPYRTHLINTGNITVKKTLEFLSQDWPKGKFIMQ